MLEVKVTPGDIVTPRGSTPMRSVPQPTYHSRGDYMIWEVGGLGLVIDRLNIRGSWKLCVLVDGKQWWVRESAVEAINEAR